MAVKITRLAPCSDSRARQATFGRCRFPLILFNLHTCLGWPGAAQGNWLRARGASSGWEPAVLRKRLHVQHLTTLCDIREQNIHEWVLPVERKTALVLARHDPLDCRQVSIAKRVVVAAKETVPAFREPSGVPPIIHNAPAYEGCNPLRPRPTRQGASRHGCGPIVYGQPSKLRTRRAALVFPIVGAFGKVYLSFWRFGHLCIWERRRRIASVITLLTLSHSNLKSSIQETSIFCYE